MKVCQRSREASSLHPALCRISPVAETPLAADSKCMLARHMAHQSKEAGEEVVEGSGSRQRQHFRESMGCKEELA